MALEAIGLGGVFTFDNSQANPQIRQSRDELGRFIKASDGVAPAMQRMGQSVSSTVAQIKAQVATLKVGMKSAVDGMRNAAMGMLPVTLAVGVGVKQSAEFEKQMSAVASVTRASAVEMDTMNKKALNMGMTSVFTSTQAGQAMEAMGRAGATTSEIVDGLGGVMNAAAADSMPLASAAQIVSQVVRGMGMEFKDSAHIADVLALASATTNTDITALGESFVYGASQARAMGFKLEEVTAAFGALANAGQRGSLGGTTFMNMLVKLSKPSRTAAGLMDKWGISLVNADGSMRKLADIVEDFRANIEQIPSKAQQAATAAEIFGLRGARAYNALSAAGKDWLLSQETLLQDASEGVGAAQEMAEKRLDNFMGSLTLFKSAVEAFSIGMFSPMLKEFTTTTKQITDGLSSVLQAMQGLTDIENNLNLERQKSAEIIGANSAAIAVNMGVSKKQQSVVMKYMKVLGEGAMAEGELTGKQKERHALATKRLTEIMSREKLRGNMTVDQAMKMIQSDQQYQASQLKTNDVYRAQMFERKKMAEIENKYGRTAMVIAQGLKDAIDDIKNAWRGAVGLVKKFGDMVRSKLGEDGLRTLVRVATTFAIIAAAMAPVILGLLAFSWTMGNVIKMVMAFKTIAFAALGLVKSGIIAMATAFWPVTVALGLLALAFVAFRKDGESIGDTLRRAFGMIKSAAIMVYDTAIKPFIQGIRDAFIPVWEEVKVVALGVWDVLKGTFNETWLAIKATMSEIAAEFMGTAQGAEINWRELGQQIIAIIGAVAVSTIQLVGFITNTVMKVVQFLLPTLKIPFTSMINFFKLFISGFQDIMNGDFMNGLNKIGIAIFDTLTMPFRAAIRTILSLVEKVPGASKVLGSGFGKAAKQFAEGGLASFTYPLMKAQNKAIGAPDSAVPDKLVPPVDLLQKKLESMNDLKTQQARRQAEKTSVNVELTDKRQINVNTDVNLDGEKVAQSTSRHRQEISDRAGFKSTPWSRRMSAEQGATLLRGGAGVG